jgi:Leucine-rich repeat (LRR) protein
MLDLSYNQFSGNIPHGIGKCCSLRMLKAGHNNIIGTLPDDLFRATSLEYLSFPNNHLQGIIDDALMIKLSNLGFLDLGGNRFSGKIPDSIGQLKRLEELHMEENNISGELPPTLGDCTNLVTINLKKNKLKGELAKVNFSTLPNLQYQVVTIFRVLYLQSTTRGPLIRNQTTLRNQEHSPRVASS